MSFKDELNAKVESFRSEVKTKALLFNRIEELIKSTFKDQVPELFSLPITTMEINELNYLTPELVLQYLILSRNSLKNLSLINCKLIGKKDFLRMEYIIKSKCLDCWLKWF